MRGVEQWQLARLITLRSQVRILSPQQSSRIFMGYESSAKVIMKKVDIAYIAGLFDGEGDVGIYS